MRPNWLNRPYSARLSSAGFVFSFRLLTYSVWFGATSPPVVGFSSTAAAMRSAPVEPPAVRSSSRRRPDGHTLAPAKVCSTRALGAEVGWTLDATPRQALVQQLPLLCRRRR
jgi:hypothetical protein